MNALSPSHQKSSSSVSSAKLITVRSMCGTPGVSVTRMPSATYTSGFTSTAYFTALRTGVRPGGTKINPAMPWAWTREMTDDEIRAVWLYLKTVPARVFGAR